MMISVQRRKNTEIMEIRKYKFRKKHKFSVCSNEARNRFVAPYSGVETSIRTPNQESKLFRADMKRCWTNRNAEFCSKRSLCWNIKVLRSGILHSSCLHTRELNTDNSCGTVLSSFRCQTLNFIFREIPEKTFVLSSFQTAQNTNAWRVYELYFVYPAWEKGETQLLEQNLHIA